MKYVILVNAHIARSRTYFSETEGEYGRTLNIKNAVKFDNDEMALKKIKELERMHFNRSFSVKEIIDTTNMI